MAGNSVIPYGRWRSVSLRWVTVRSYRLSLTFLTKTNNSGFDDDGVQCPDPGFENPNSDQRTFESTSGEISKQKQSLDFSSEPNHDPGPSWDAHRIQSEWSEIPNALRLSRNVPRIFIPTAFRLIPVLVWLGYKIWVFYGWREARVTVSSDQCWSALLLFNGFTQSCDVSHSACVNWLAAHVIVVT